MIKPEDIRIGDLVRTNRDCAFPKDTKCVVTDVRTGKVFKDKVGVVFLSAIYDDDDGPWETWCNDIDGVPITPEILRNNDFKEEVEGKYFTRPIKARFGSPLARYLVVEQKKYSWAIFIKYYNVTGYALLCHVKYVHELQLALKIMKFSPENESIMSFNNTKTPNKPIGKAKWQVPMRPNEKSGAKEYYLEGELKERFCKLFPKNSNRRMMTWFGIGFSTLQRFKREFGLEKDMPSIRKQHAKDIKKICERNGYYASIRGKKPSEASIEATRQLRAAGFHPMKQLKANNPRRYKQLMRKKSEQRKELWRKERLRAFYGLDRQTNLHIPSNPMSRKAISHKYAMIKACNYFADPLGDPHIICYDSETQRSAQREATAAKHGLKVVEADE